MCQSQKLAAIKTILAGNLNILRARVQQGRILPQGFSKLLPLKERLPASLVHVCHQVIRLGRRRPVAQHLEQVRLRLVSFPVPGGTCEIFSRLR